eukprot:553145_1
MRKFVLVVLYLVLCVCVWCVKLPPNVQEMADKWKAHTQKAKSNPFNEKFKTKLNEKERVENVRKKTKEMADKWKGKNNPFNEKFKTKLNEKQRIENVMKQKKFDKFKKDGMPNFKKDGIPNFKKDGKPNFKNLKEKAAGLNFKNFGQKMKDKKFSWDTIMKQQLNKLKPKKEL